MSSSHRSDLHFDDEKLIVLSKETYICPECNAKTMKRVSGFCDVNDELCLENLERLHCMSCGADFFDMTAMEKIRFANENNTREMQADGDVV